MWSRYRVEYKRCSTYKIKDLMGVGIVSFRDRKGINMVSLKVRKKDHLLNKILPIFDKYPLFFQ